MYEINIALNGIHFFATHERSITNVFELKKILPILIEKFPESEGYTILISKTTISSEYMDKSKFI